MDSRIERAADGDTEALGDLLYERYDRLQAFVARRLGDKLKRTLDAEDVLQQAFTDTFRSIRHFQPKSERAFWRWVEQVCENTLLDMARAANARKRGGDLRRVAANRGDSVANLLDQLSTGGASPSGLVAREEGVRALVVEIARLPDDYRQAIELREIQGLSREEVAAEMGRTPDEVRGLLYRARKKLRDAMGGSSLYWSRKQ